MALQNFVHAVTTITHTWLNKIDVLFSTIFDEATTKAEARAALGVVGLMGNETVAGIKTFSSDQVINGIEIGRGGGSVASNTTFGNTALDSNTTGAATPPSAVLHHLQYHRQLQHRRRRQRPCSSTPRAQATPPSASTP